MTTSAVLDDFTAWRAKIIFSGSIVSSLAIPKRCGRVAALCPPLLSLYLILAYRLVFQHNRNFYFSLFFNDKRKVSVCDVRFVPNV